MMTLNEILNAYNNRTITTIETLEKIDDATALAVTALFPEWSVGTDYTANTRIRYNGKLYRVVQSHTSQSDWTPDVTPALYTEIAEPGTIPVWRKPTGAQDAYTTGDKVHYPTADDAVWVSTVDNNVWEPGVYGWEED